MIQTDGLNQLLNDLDYMKTAIESNEFVQAIEKEWSIVTNKIRDNAASSFNVKTGLLLDSKSIITHAGVTFDQDAPFIFAEAGVFKSDSSMTERGLNAQKDIPASMYAYWLEFGTRDHYNQKGIKMAHPSRSGGVSAGELKSLKMTQGIEPTYFISRAHDEVADIAYDGIVARIGEMIDKAML